MNHNYPEYILKKLRERVGNNEDDTSQDEEFQEMSPEDVLNEVLEWDGICGYASTILRWIQDIYKVKLDPYGEYQSKQDFVHGLGNIFRAQDHMDGVTAMRMDEKEKVTIYFEGGGTKRANCEMDSRRATISDILKQGF